MKISLDTEKRCGRLQNFWSAVHFHPTDAIEDEWGQNVIKKIKAGGAARFMRIYAMLEDIVTKDEKGNLLYDFTENDKRMDFLAHQGFDLLVCINFMPDAIASDPGRDMGIPRYKGKRVNNSVPYDYSLFEEVCYNYAKHIYSRYGESAKRWCFHCWNEPDHEYWVSNKTCFEYEKNGDSDKITEYVKLYKAFERGFSRACLYFKIGGPSAAFCSGFIREFLAYVKKESLRLDFLTVHAYSDLPYEGTNGKISPENIVNTVKNAQKMLLENGLLKTDVIVDEWGAAAGGFLSIEKNPVMKMRENEFLAAFYFRLTDLFIRSGAPPRKMLLCLSGQHKSKYDFDGYRSMFTKSGFEKPVFNAFRLLGRLKDIRLCCNEEECIATINENGDIAIALYSGGENPEEEVFEKDITLCINNISGKYLMRKSVIDKTHSNAYGYWQSIGAPRPIPPAEKEKIKQRAKLFAAEEKITLGGSFLMGIPLSGASAVLIELIKTEEAL